MKNVDNIICAYKRKRLQENRFIQLVNDYFLGIMTKKEYNSYNGYGMSMIRKL